MRPNASPYLLLALASFFWACNWIVGRGLHADIPPLALNFYRWLIAAAILAPLALPHVQRDWDGIRRRWTLLVPLGMVGIAAHNSLAYVGLGYTTATSGVLLNSFSPVMIIALSRVFTRDRLSPVQAAGVAVSLAGVLTILSEGSLDALVSFRPNVGDVLIIASMALWAIYTIGLRHRPASLHPLAFLFALICIGDAAMLPLYALETASGHPVHWTPATVLALGGVALFSSVLAYVFWNRGVEQVGANVAGLFVHLMPVFGVLLAWLVLDERLAAFHLAGIALIVAGIYLTSRYAGVRPYLSSKRTMSSSPR